MNPKELFNLDRFKQKLGPLPVWAWGLIIGVIAVLIYYIWSSKKGAVDVPVGATPEDANFAAADKQQNAADAGYASYIAALDKAQAELDATAPAPAPASAAPTSTYENTYSGGGYSGGGGNETPAASYAPPVALINTAPPGKTQAKAPITKNLYESAPQKKNSVAVDIFGPAIGGFLDSLFTPPKTTIVSGPTTKPYVAKSATTTLAKPAQNAGVTPPKPIAQIAPAPKISLVTTLPKVTLAGTPAAPAAPAPAPAPVSIPAPAVLFKPAPAPPAAIARPAPAPAPVKTVPKTSTGRPVNKGMY